MILTVHRASAFHYDVNQNRLLLKMTELRHDYSIRGANFYRGLPLRDAELYRLIRYIVINR